MKKLLLITAAFNLFIITSCKKDRTCKCTYDDGDITTTEFFKVRKKDARLNCMSNQTTTYDSKTATSSTGRKRTCELK
jgi:hypothetical protein